MMKFFWFLLSAVFAGLAINAGYRAYQEFLSHPGTRGMTEAGAGVFVVAMMSIFSVMAFNKGREIPATEKRNPDDPPAER